MDFTPETRKKISRWVIGTVTICILIYVAVQNIGVIANAVSWVFGILAPLILGFFMALILNVPVRFFERHLFRKSKKKITQKAKRPLSIVLALVLILGIFAGIVGLVIPELVDAVTVIINSAKELVNKINQMENSAVFDEIPFGEYLRQIDWSVIDWNKITDSVTSWLTEQGGSIMNTAVGTISSVFIGVVNFVVAVIFAIYILVSKEKLRNQATRILNAWLPKNVGKTLIHVFDVSHKIFGNFVSGQTIEALILGVLCMVGMLILNIPYAPMIGALVGVTAYIPVVGAFIGTVIGAFMIITVSPAKALIFVIYLLILQQIEGNLIYPKVMGDKINLPALWVLAAVTVGGGIAGPVGMLLGVPATSAIYELVREATAYREQKRKAKEISAEDAPAE